ncbi:uncharacterized protein JCM15063_006508 [Sporobolomyces koalae]|uniref:uncharacterized protein n=1 Tax=Sporobolomyces koalae TaxID=500713 RepID=UPI003172836F
MAESTVKLGKRAQTTERALQLACAKVIGVLNDKTMKQCFPKYQDEFLQNLQKIVVDKFNVSVPHAWEDHAKEFDFLRKLDEFDVICMEAEQRRNRKETPQNHYAIGGDGSITIPSATVPILRTATEELREKRQALEEENAKTYERISAMSSSTRTSEAQIQKILGDFEQVLSNTAAVDTTRLTELRNEMVRVVGHNL